MDEFCLGVLRLSPDVFWKMTPREIEASYEGYYEREKEKLLDDWRFGTLAMLLAEPYRDTKKRNKPYGPEDFFPSLKEIVREQTTQPVRAQAPEEMKAILVAHTAAIAANLGLSLADCGLEEYA